MILCLLRWLFVFASFGQAITLTANSDIKSVISTPQSEYKNIKTLAENKPDFKNIELLTDELRILRSDCLAGQTISIKRLSLFILRLGDLYDPLYIKLFDDLYNLCFDLHNEKQFKSCWWLLQRVQKIYLNSHSPEQLRVLNLMRVGLQNLAMLALKMLESASSSQFLIDIKRRNVLIEENILDAVSLHCGLINLRFARKSFEENNFSLMSNYVHKTLSQLTQDSDYLLKYIESNHDQMEVSHNIFIYLRTMIHSIQEVGDLVELLDTATFAKYFSANYSGTVQDYLAFLDDQAKQRLKFLQKFVSRDFMRGDQNHSDEMIKYCVQSLQNVLTGLQLHNVDNGVWLELNAVNDFEKTYGKLKFLANKQYIKTVPRKTMRNCFSNLKFRYPVISTNYQSFSITQ